MDYELDFSIFMAYIPTINGLVGKSSPETIGIFPLNILKKMGRFPVSIFPKENNPSPSGWWFGTFFIFPHIYILGRILPTD